MEQYKHQFYTLLRENLGLCVVSCGAEGCPPEHSWGPGQRDFFLLHLVRSGKGSFEQNGIRYPVQAGQAFLIFPGETVSYRADSADPWEYLWVGFTGADAARLAEGCGFVRSAAVIDTEQPDELFARFESIYRQRGNTAADEMCMCAALLQLLAAMNAATPAAQSVKGDCAARAVHYIERNYCNDIRIENVAAAVGISRSQLFRVFKERFGMSVSRFLTRYRIGIAAALLRKGEMSIGETAYSVGFFDQLYFSRVFKKEKGVTPSEYLRKHRDPSS